MDLLIHAVGQIQKFTEFLDHFIHHMKSTKNKKVLLLMDNHESHVSIAAITKARENSIIMLTFPQHTSHKLQPLDRCVFGPFKNYYNAACSNWMLTNLGKQVSVYSVGHLTSVAYPRCSNPIYIYI
jgi:hypothetical protein